MARAELKFATRKITPKLAEELLAKNTSNRPLSQRHVDVLVGAMKRGEWLSSGDTIKISTQNVLLDGQHRLNAIVQSGVTIEMVIASGVQPEAFHVIDTGAKARGASDILAIQGEEKPHVLAAAVRIIKNWEVHQDMTTNTYSWTTTELEEVLSRHPQLRKFTDTSAAINKLIPPSFSCAFSYLFCLVNAAHSEQFMERLATGAGLEQGHPILLLRDILMANKVARAKLPKKTIAALIIKAFNLYSSGKKVARLTWSTTDKFPAIEIAKARAAA